MTLDRLQSKAGQFVVSPENAQTTTGTLTTVVSNQVPGGIAFGSIAGFAGGTASSAGGGALYMIPTPAGATGTNGQTMATGGTISNNGAGYVAYNATTTANNLQLQPPQYPGQFMYLQNVGSVSCSFVSIGTVTNWSTSGTVTAQIVDAAFTAASFNATSTGAPGGQLFIASPFHVSTTGQWPIAIWHRIV